MRAILNFDEEALSESTKLDGEWNAKACPGMGPVPRELRRWSYTLPGDSRRKQAE